MNPYNDYHGMKPVDNKSIDRFFGIAVAGFFLALALAPLVKGEQIRIWSLYFSIALLIAGVSYPRVLTPFRKVWVRFGLQLQKITQPLLMGMIYYILLTPFGVVMRFVGKDPLLLKKRSSVTSYWLLRANQQANADMNNQF